MTVYTVKTFSSNPYDPLTNASQRQSWTSNGRYWIVYENGTNTYCTSSPDGVSWSVEQVYIIHSMSTGQNRGYKDSVYFDGTYMYFIVAGDTNSEVITVKKFQPNNDGTLTLINSSEIPNSLNLGWKSIPSISTNSNDYPVAAYCSSNGLTDYKPVYNISTSTEGNTWGNTKYIDQIVPNSVAISISPLNDSSMLFTYFSGGIIYAQRMINDQIVGDRLILSSNAYTYPATTGNYGDTIYICWVEGDSSLQTLKFNTYRLGEGLGTPTTITTGSSIYYASISILTPSGVSSRASSVVVFADGKEIKYAVISKEGISGSIGSVCTAATSVIGLNIDDRIDSVGTLGVYWEENPSNWVINFSFIKPTPIGEVIFIAEQQRENVWCHWTDGKEDYREVEKYVLYLEDNKCIVLNGSIYNLELLVEVGSAIKEYFDTVEKETGSYDYALMVHPVDIITFGTEIYYDTVEFIKMDNQIEFAVGGGWDIFRHVVKSYHSLTEADKNEMWIEMWKTGTEDLTALYTEKVFSLRGDEILSTKNIVPFTTDNYNIGDTTKKWKQIFSKISKTDKNTSIKLKLWNGR